MRWLKTATTDVSSFNDGTSLFTSIASSAEKILISAAYGEETKTMIALPEPEIYPIISEAGSYSCLVLKWNGGSVFCFPDYVWASDEKLTTIYNTEAKALKAIRSKGNEESLVEVKQLDQLPDSSG